MSREKILMSRVYTLFTFFHSNWNIVSVLVPSLKQASCGAESQGQVVITKRVSYEFFFFFFFQKLGEIQENFEHQSKLGDGRKNESLKRRDLARRGLIFQPEARRPHCAVLFCWRWRAPMMVPWRIVSTSCTTLHFTRCCPQEMTPECICSTA